MPGARDDTVRARRAGNPQGGDRAARSRRPHGAADRGWNRPDADDEGRRVCAEPAGEPGQRQHAQFDQGQRRADDWRHDAAGGARALGGGEQPCTGHRQNAAHALQHPRSQRCDDRRQPRARRSAHGPAACSGRARRPRGGDGQIGRAHDPRGKTLRRLLRDRAGARRADPQRHHPGAGQPPFGLSQVHHAGGARLAGARCRGVGRQRGRHRARGFGRGERRDRDPGPASRCRAGFVWRSRRGCTLAAGRRGSGRERAAYLRRPGLGRLQEAAGAGLRGARARRRAERRRALMATLTQVGRSVPRLEGQAKVTGRAKYVHNLRLPGMLYGKIVRSTVAHGRIVNLDVSAAQALEGVYRVVTIDDVLKVVPSPFYGPAFHDQPILAAGKVHYVGEPIAVVLARDPHVAEAAAQLVEAEYEELPAVFDEVEAMTSKAVVHDELKPAGTFPDLKHLKGKRDTNVALDFHLRRGDVATAMAEADHVFEHTFRTQQVLHLPLEPYVSIGEPTDTGLTIHTASQSPSFVRIEIARLLGWPENKVRVKVPYLGGGFGGKLYIKLEALVAALALLVRRPVKIALTMEEQFYTLTKHASTFRIKSAVKDGRITARECEVWWNGGAYADI